MKIKILLVPFLIVLAIVLVVWVALPRYYDDKLKRGELKTEENRLGEIKKKVEVASKLMVELGAKADKQEILFSFLPEKQEEEEIINDLNNIASMEAISIKNLTTEKNLNVPAYIVPNVTEGEVVDKNTSQPNEFKIKFTVIGEYGKIKNVIDRLAKLKRFNKASSLMISKVDENQTGEVTSGSNLKAEMDLSFYYLKKADAVSISSAVFSQGSFNMAPIEKINNLRTINVLNIGNTSAGRENPFMQ